jgi:predicted nucleotidyltransferase
MTSEFLESYTMKRIDPNTERAIRAFLAGIEGRYDIAGVILYGSRARGTHDKESNADLAVILKGERRRFLPVKLDMGDTAFDVMLETDILISPLPVWVDEWEHPEDSWNPALLGNIGREGIRL